MPLHLASAAASWAFGLGIGAVVVRWWVLVAMVLRVPRCVVAIDVVLSVLLLVAHGPASPAALWAIASAVTAGVLQREVGAALSSVLLAGANWKAAVEWGLGHSYEIVVGVPSLYLLLSLAAARFSTAGTGRAGDVDSVVADAVSRERQRFARDLHDSVSKTAVGVSLQAAALRRRLGDVDGPTATAASELCAAAEEAARQARTVLSGLRDAEAPTSLRAAAQSAIAVVEAETGRSIGRRLMVDEVDADPDVLAEVRLIIVEALRNAATHAGARSIDAATVSDGDAVEVTVNDDGRGFDLAVRCVEAVHEGRYGLTGMAERARAIGADLTVDSVSGDGTTVTLRLAPGGSGR